MSTALPSLEIPLNGGDVVLFARPCLSMDLFSAAICLSSKSVGGTVYDHVGLAVEHPLTRETLLLEANAKGITLYPLRDRLQRTKAPQVAVRKLLRESTATAAESDSERERVRRDFDAELYALAQEYVSAKYNTSLLQMSAATVMSYAGERSSFVQRLRLAHHLEDDLGLVAQLLSDTHTESNNKSNSDSGNNDSNSKREEANGPRGMDTLTQRLLKQSPFFLRGLLRRKEDIQRKLQHISHQLTKEETSADVATASKQSDRYYCSQLAAEILMRMRVLHSDHRHAHQYIPADFSSSTAIKALYANRQRSSASMVEKKGTEGEDDRFAFSCDFVFDPQQARFSQREHDKQTMLSFPLWSFSAENAPTSVDDSSNKKKKRTMSIPLHVNDSVPAEILSQTFAPNSSDTASPSLSSSTDLSIAGSVRISSHGRVVGVVRSSREHPVAISRYLCSLSQIYGEKNLALHAYNDSSELLITPIAAPSALTEEDIAEEKEHFEMMFLEEALRQAWLGFHKAFGAESEHDLETKSAVDLMDACVASLPSKDRRSLQLQLHWQQLKDILGEEVLDLLEHHQFAHHSFETAEHKHGIHARQVLYALKHYFYLLLLFDAAKEKGDDQALARSVWQYMLKHFVLEDSNVWVKEATSPLSDQERREKAIKKSLERFNDHLTQRDETSSAVLKSSVLLLFSAVPLGLSMARNRSSTTAAHQYVSTAAMTYAPPRSATIFPFMKNGFANFVARPQQLSMRWRAAHNVLKRFMTK